MFGFRPKLPVSPDQSEWIEDSFRHLCQLFGPEWVRTAPVVLPNEHFFPQKWEPTETWARFVFDRTCDLMRVEKDRVELIFFEDPWQKLTELGVGVRQPAGSLGLYHKIEVEKGQSLAQIRIKESLFNEPERMVSTMAHELAHVLLLGDNRIERDLEKMEELTDLLTVYCGFGILRANSTHIHQTSSRGWSVSRSGYMTPREYGYSLAVFTWLRGDASPPWEKELGTNVRAFMRATLASFKASRRPQ